MNQTPNGPDDEVREALAAAVRSYGPAVLGNAQMLGNILTDLLPDHPRERSLLVAAAEAEAAALLQEQVGRQRLDSGTAVALTARTLMERRALDPTAARWVTAAYATALGYNPPPVVASPPVPAEAEARGDGTGPTDRIPYVPTQQPVLPSLPDAPTLITPPGSGSSLPPVPPAGGFGPAPGAGQQSPGQPSFGQPSFGQPSFGEQSFGQQSFGRQSLPPQGFGPPGGGTPGGGYPGGGGPSAPVGTGYQPAGGGPGKRPTLLLVVAAAAAVVLIGYLALAGAAHLPPFHTSAARGTTSPSPVDTSPSATSTPTPTPTPTPSPSPTGPVLAPGVTPVLDILSTSLPDPATQCRPSTAGSGKFTIVGVVAEYYCTDTNLPGGGIWAYQMDSQADYQTTWVNYNKWWGFSDSSAGNTCPPSGGGTGGLSGWHDSAAGYPDRSGQVLECQMVGSGSSNDQPSYTWSLPTQDTFFIAQGAKGSGWSVLNNWWAKDAPPQPSSTPTSTSS